MRASSFAAHALALLAASTAHAHFQEILPTRDMVTPGNRDITIDLLFTHPMAGGPAMEMAKPVRFGVLGTNGHQQDLSASLQPRTVDGKQAWQAPFSVRQPGNYVFYVEPAPYWEPAEGKMIIHYSKVVVDAFDWGAGWERMVGFPIEIEPLVRPYGLWTGNLFQGVVKQDGLPLPFAEVEVEWVNDGSLTPPADAFLTQVIKADGNGVFSYAMPRAGWWGFAALVEGKGPMPGPDGTEVPVELGGLMWIRTVDMK